MTLIEQAQQLETAAHVIEDIVLRAREPRETLNGVLNLSELDALETAIKTLYSRALAYRELEGKTSC